VADVKILISAKDEASRVLSQVQNNLSKTTSILSSVGGAFGLVGTLSVGALAAMAKSTIDGLDALNDLRDATGSSIENLSALEDIAARTGTSFDTVGQALTKFNKALQSADKGSPTEAALKAIGLSVQELKDLDPAEALLKTAVALDGYATDGNKARLVSVLFGKSLSEVAPLLNDLAEKGRLNATVTTEQALEAEKLNKEFFNLGKNSTDLARSIAGPLVSALNKTIELFRQGTKEGKSWRETMADAQWSMIRGWLNMPSGPKEYSARLAEISEKLKDNNLHSSRRAALLREQSALEGKLAADPDYSLSNARSDARLLRQAGKASVGNIPDAAKAPKAEQIDDARRSLGSYVEALQKTIDGTDKLTESQKAQQFLASLGNLGEVSQVRELVNGMAERIDKEKELIEARKQSAASLKEMAADNDAQAKENDSLAEKIQLIGLTKEGVNALTLARMDATIAQEQELADQLAMNDASAEELALINQKIKLLKTQRSLTAGGQIAQAAADTAQEQADASKKFSDELHNDVKGALSTAFRDTKDPIGAFGDALGNVVYTRITNALADSLATQLLGGPNGGGLLSSALAFLSFDGGGYTGSGVRTGGLDGKGGFMAVMHPNESVIDHTKGQRTSQPVTVVQNFTVGDVASISMVRQAVATSQRQIVSAFARSQNYGGAVA
jgi:hypothetical protein